VNGPTSGKFDCIISQITLAETLGSIPDPSNVLIKYCVIFCSTLSKLSPVFIPNSGIFSPVYLTHLSDVISTHPLKQFEQDIFLFLYYFFIWKVKQWF